MTTWRGISVKLFGVKECYYHYKEERVCIPGQIRYQKQNDVILVQCGDGKWVTCKSITISKKRNMTAKDFCNGYLLREKLENRMFI